MAKKRKTLEKKKLADLRHTFTHTIVNQPYFEAKNQIKLDNLVKLKEREKIISDNKYPYLVKDLSKTGALTTAILTFQIILFFLLKNHILQIPGLSY